MPSNLILTWADEGGPRMQELVDGIVTIGRLATSEIVLDANLVSRSHARITAQDGRAVIEDLGSRNGTLVNDERISTVELRPGDEIAIGGVSLLVGGVRETAPSMAASMVGLEATVAPAMLEQAAPEVGFGTILVKSMPPPPSASGGGIPDELMQRPLVSEAALIAAGVPVLTVEVAALGGGVGSFVLVDMLRCAGMPTTAITVVGNETYPFGRYERLCENSQIPRHERLRSNSDSCPDNMWGFPGYATREVVRSLVHGNLALAGSISWKIFGEPAISQTYTPRLGDVIASTAREAQRIGYSQMLQVGRVRAIRKSDSGRLLAIVSQGLGEQRRQLVVSARVLHLSIGYPSIQMLDDLAEYREKHGDFRHVVNAYEEHSHIYEALRERGGVVVLRGRGIVASRIIQRLWEERAKNKNIKVVHLHRSRLADGHHFGPTRRKVEEQFEFQPFNWPKACWGGEMLTKLEKATPEGRKALLDAWGGTSTAARSDWREMVREGVHDGWFRLEYGTVRKVEPTADGRVATTINSTLAGGGELDLVADWVIDCTGLVAAPRRSPLLADLLDNYTVPLNPLGRLSVSSSFEVESMRNGDSRFYAAGAMTLGGPMAAVDSFLGLQFAALRAVDGMADMKLNGFHRLNGLRSFAAWTRWVRKAAP